MTKGTPASSQIIWLEQRVAHLEEVLEAEKLTRNAANAILGEQLDGLIAALAKCSDAFPAPVPGSELDGYYVGAIADPLAVPEYVVAQVAALTKDAAWFVKFQVADDGLWVHFTTSDQAYSQNLSADRMSKPFADAYIAAMAQKGTT